MSKKSAAADKAMWENARQRALRSIANTSDEEDARLTAAALADPDNPPLTKEFWRRARPASEVHPDIVADYLAGRIKMPNKRGLQVAPTKLKVSLRIDQDVVAKYKASGKGWQSRMNDDLRKAAEKLKLPEAAE
jgi:uncharacterized protein (DUF4415 family)